MKTFAVISLLTFIAATIVVFQEKNPYENMTTKDRIEMTGVILHSRIQDEVSRNYEVASNYTNDFTIDAWGNKFMVIEVPESDNKMQQMISAGADQIFGTRDDQRITYDKTQLKR
jgi:hypothetical protein